MPLYRAPTPSGRFPAMSVPTARIEGRVLVVDDTESKRYLLTQTLRMAGLEVMEASTGQEALRAARGQPDVVLLDVRLPDMSGFEVCQRLKADPDTAAIAVLYVSTLLQDVELEARLFEDGADGYVPQPIEPKHLLAQTWALVRMRRAERARVHEREEALREQARLARALEGSQARARRLTESGLVGIFYWDLDGSVLGVNDALVGLLGYAREEWEARGFDWRILTPPEAGAHEWHERQGLHALGVGPLRETHYLRKDGTRLDVLLGSAAFDGEPGRGVTMVMDITARRDAERRLRQLMGEWESSEARLRLALEAAELGSWSYSLTQRAFQGDARTRELFGLGDSEPLSLASMAARLHPEDRERMWSTARERLSGAHGGMFRVEGRTVGAEDGRVRWLSVRGRVHLGPEGRADHIAGLCQDITERKLGERRAADFQATTAAFAHALTEGEVCRALLDHGLHTLEAYAGSVCEAREGALWPLANFGYDASIDRPAYPLHEGMPFTHVVRTGTPLYIPSPEALERDWPALARGLKDARSRAWLCMPLRDGERMRGVLWLSFTAPRRLGVEEQAHLEALCQLFTQALGRARLYAAERRASDEARQREALEQRYLGMVSHDLRNPLQAIALGARTLQRMEQPSPEALLRMTGRIAHSADIMGRMVSDLLDFTRGRLGGGIPLERRPEELVGLCREVLDEFSLSHPEHRVVLEGMEDCEGQWDASRLRQVLCNLIGNALRHARPGTPVRVRVTGGPAEAQLEVHNEGEPIPAELLPVLFEPFRRGSTHFRPAGSLGLGLYIVRQVVDGHGGQVEVRTGPPGTAFLVRLPRQSR